MPSKWNKSDRTRELRPGPELDPYFIWAEHTGAKGLRMDATGLETGCVQIAIRIPEGTSARALLGGRLGLKRPAVYARAIPGSRKLARHFTATIELDRLRALSLKRPQLVWTLSQPLRDAERAARASVLGRFGPAREPRDFVARNLLEDVVRRQHRREAAEGPQPHVPPAALIAVVDFGCPFLNQRYAEAPDSLNTRLLAVWDQGSRAPDPTDKRVQGGGWPWQPCDRMGYGRELRAGMLQAMFEAVRNDPTIDEAEVYRGLDTLIDYDDARRRVRFATHGAHVLDVAGGHSHPITGQRDAASDARLVFVQLPMPTASDSSGASLTSHLLDAVRYVLTFCGPNTRVVVNISYGSHGGPHDGHSMIEAAFDELLEARGDNFAIVLSAGNSRAKQCHARRAVRPERSALLRVALAGGDTTDSFVQAWYHALPGWKLLARVRSPNRSWSDWVEPGAQELLLVDSADGGEPAAMLIHQASTALHEEGEPDAGQKQAPRPRSLVMLALAPTSLPLGVSRALATPGLWELELALHPMDDKLDAREALLMVDARIERDDPGQNPGAAEHRFLDQDFDDELETLSNLASGRHTLLAGGMRLSDRRQTDYSSVGRRRDAPPMVLAPCEEDEVNPTIAATAVRSGEFYRMKGTSVAAPMLARAVMNRMLKKPLRRIRRDQWAAVLAAMLDDPQTLLAPVQTERDRITRD